MTEPLTKIVRVACPVAQAFDLFTSKVNVWWPAGHRKLPNSTLKLETRSGGRFYEQGRDGAEHDFGAVLQCDPPHQISYSWTPGSISKPTRVDVSFVEDEGETLITVVHSEADGELGTLWPAKVVLFDRSWDHVFAAFTKAVLNLQEHKP